MPEEPRISYPVATWVAPVVPTVALLGLVAVGSGVDEGPSGDVLGLGVTVAILVVGLVVALAVPGRHLRGLGLGVAVGAAVTCLGWLTVLVT